jgi:hypothetical protein
MGEDGKGGGSVWSEDERVSDGDMYDVSDKAGERGIVEVDDAGLSGACSID